MNDMISQIELADAVTAYSKLQKRLLEVGLFLADHDGFLDSVPKDQWQMERFHISTDIGRGAYDEPMSTVTIKLWGSGSRILKELDHPDWEDFRDSDGRTYTPSKVFTFPTRYIHTQGWEAEVEQKSREQRAWWCRRNIAGLEKALRDHDNRRTVLETELAKQRRDLVK